MTTSAQNPTRRIPKKSTSIEQARKEPESVATGDFIDYRLSLEVAPQPGQKAWVTYGGSFQVRDGESTHEACDRIHRFVEDGLDERIRAHSEEP